MVYVKKVKIKGIDYWYLFHTVRDGEKYLKKSKYIGRELPGNIEEIKRGFEEELKNEPKGGDFSKLVESLSPLERKIIPFLKERKLSKIIEKSGLKDVEVMRALQWLENKEIIKSEKEIKEIVELDKNGVLYKERGLPEKRFLKLLDRDKTLNELKEQLNQDEINVSLGILKSRGLIQIGEKIKKLKEGDKILELTEEFLNKLPLNLSKLSAEEKFVYNEFKRRRDIIKTRLVKEREIKLTKLGEELSKENLKLNLIENLTSDILKNKSWKGKRFRRYDIKINVPKIYGGRRHFVNQALDYTKKIWLDMGFKEMNGNLVQTSFWNFDALFVPQDHPAREMQDTFFVNGNKPIEMKEFINKVKRSHEENWKYKWDSKEGERLILRTHTTVLSALTLANLKKEDIPGKYFAVGKCFRNEALDWSHLFEFNQTEGIVIDENANLRNLMGYLREFANKMGFPKVRFRPAYFPYTSPSLEGDIYDSVHKKWIEFIAAGIFRPEVVKPLLGRDIPVLAWGPGIDRMITSAYNIQDIRELYKNDLKQLKEIKAWVK